MWVHVQTIWRPALEILILTVGIYYAFRFVRGTRGAPVVTGFLVLLLAFGNFRLFDARVPAIDSPKNAMIA